MKEDLKCLCFESILAQIPASLCRLGIGHDIRLHSFSHCVRLLYHSNFWVHGFPFRNMSLNISILRGIQIILPLEKTVLVPHTYLVSGVEKSSINTRRCMVSAEQAGGGGLMV